MIRILPPLILALGLSGCSGIAHSAATENAGCGEAGFEFGPTDLEIRQMIIRASIRSYSDTCVCPYDLAANGSQCREQSVYLKADGDKPLCFERDVDQAMVAEFRSNLK